MPSFGLASIGFSGNATGRSIDPTIRAQGQFLPRCTGSAPWRGTEGGPMSIDHVDVLIVGAGISGIGAAHHLLADRPGTTFAILECQEGYGGTWRTHSYPGVRSDSDLYTFGYAFKPWTGAPIATAEEILRYLGEVVEEDGPDQNNRYRHQLDPHQRI